MECFHRLSEGGFIDDTTSLTYCSQSLLWLTIKGRNVRSNQGSRTSLLIRVRHHAGVQSAISLGTVNHFPVLTSVPHDSILPLWIPLLLSLTDSHCHFYACLSLPYDAEEICSAVGRKGYSTSSHSRCPQRWSSFTDAARFRLGLHPLAVLGGYSRNAASEGERWWLKSCGSVRKPLFGMHKSRNTNACSYTIAMAKASASTATSHRS